MSRWLNKVGSGYQAPMAYEERDFSQSEEQAQQNSGSAKNLSSSSYGNFFGGWKIIE